MEFRVETEREDDGRWIAEIVEIPGAMAYGDTKDSAIASAEAIALRVIADQTESAKKPLQKAVAFVA